MGWTGPLRIWVKLVWGWLHATLNWLVMVWGEPTLGQRSLSTFQGPLGTGWEVEALQGHHEAQLKSYSCPWDSVKIWVGWGSPGQGDLTNRLEQGRGRHHRPTGQVSGCAATGNRRMASQTGRWSQGCPTKFSLPGTDLALGVWQRLVGRG